jgi:hypothetical protein
MYCTVPTSWDANPAAARITIPLAMLFPFAPPAGAHDAGSLPVAAAAAAPPRPPITRLQLSSNNALSFAVDNIAFI